MRFPRSGLRPLFAFFAWLSFLFLTPNSQSAPLSISPSVVNGNSSTVQQFTATGGVPPYTWSSTLGGITPWVGNESQTVEWVAGGVYPSYYPADLINEAIYIWRIIPELPSGSCPSYGGVQFVPQRMEIYNCKGELSYVGNGCTRPESNQWLLDHQLNGVPQDARDDWLKRAG